ncbi:MAG: hypothetical protein WC760_06390 [Bacteroidia bacterium]|jgi:hypothetical protein
MKKVIIALVLILGIGLAFANQTGIHPALSILGVTALASLASPMQGVITMGPSTDVAAIAKWAGLNSKKMLAQMLNDLDIFKDMAVDRMVSRHGKLLPKFTAQGGLRPLNYNVETRAGTQRNWSGRKLFVYDAMKIFDIVPDELLESFMSDMMVPGAIQIPFAQWVWQKEMAKLAAEINDNSYLADYGGDAAAWDAGAEYTYDAAVPQYKTFGDDEDIYKLLADTTAGQSPTTHPAKWSKVNESVTCTGIGTLIADEITAANITPITTGAISASNALDKLEVMYNDMTAAHRKVGGIVRVGPDVFRHYINHERDVFGATATSQTGDGRKYLYGTGNKWEVRECNWMGASGRVIMTQFDNLIGGTNLVEMPGVTKTIETLHGTKSVSKFLIGFEIADLENLYVNDQA